MYGDLSPKTSLMLHMDGSDQGTTFNDSSSYANVVTPHGDAKTVVSGKLFGTASYTTSSGYLSIPTTLATDRFNFGTEDFTVDFYFKKSDYNPQNILGGSTTADNAFKIRVATSFSLAWNGTYLNLSGTFPLNSWNHVAFVRTSGTMSGYINGEFRGSTAAFSGQVMTLGNSVFYVGNAYSDIGYPSSFSGQLDEVRMTRNLALWTTDFVGNLPVPSAVVSRETTVPYTLTSTPTSLTFNTEDQKTDALTLDSNTQELIFVQSGDYLIDYSGLVATNVGSTITIQCKVNGTTVPTNSVIPINSGAVTNFSFRNKFIYTALAGAHMTLQASDLGATKAIIQTGLSFSAQQSTPDVVSSITLTNVGSGSSILSIGSTSVAKGSPITVTADSSLMAALSVISSDNYYVSPSNWKQVIFIYGMAGYSKLKVIILDNNGSNLFSKSLTPFSSRAKSGTWKCRSIIINDYEGDFFEIVGSDIPTNLDVIVP